MYVGRKILTGCMLLSVSNENVIQITANVFMAFLYVGFLISSGEHVLVAGSSRIRTVS